MTWNVVKRFANRDPINCLFHMISQSDMLIFYGTEKIVCFKQRGLSETKKTRSRSFWAVVSKVWLLVFCQTSWHNLRGLSTLRNHLFSRKQVQEREDWGGSTTRPGAAETAASFIGSGVIGSLERTSIKFHFRHSGVSSAVKELPLRSSPE